MAHRLSLSCLWAISLAVCHLSYHLSDAAKGEAGLQVLKADVQAWYLDVQQRIALQPGFVENLRFGLTFRVSFNQILFVSGQTEVAALTEEQSDHLAASISVRLPSREFRFNVSATKHEPWPAGAEYLLLPAFGSSVPDLVQWLSLFENATSSNPSELCLLLAFPNIESARSVIGEYQRTDFVLKQDLKDNTASVLTDSLGNPFRESVAFSAAALPTVSYNVVHRQRCNESCEGIGGKIKPRKEAVQGGAPSVRQTHRDDNWEEDMFDRDRLQDITYTSFIQTNASSSDFDKAVEAGWELRKQFGTDSWGETSLLQVQNHLQTENSAGLATGFILSTIVSGFLPDAIKQATNKMINIMEDDLVPMMKDLLAGNDASIKRGYIHPPASFLELSSELHERLGIRTRSKDPKDTGQTGLAEPHGALAVAISADVIKSTWPISDYSSDVFSSRLTEDLYSRLASSSSEPLAASVVNAVTPMAMQALPQTIPPIITGSLKRMIPGYVVQALANTLTNTLTRSVGHALTQTLQHSLLRAPALELACYQCHYAQKDCEHCYSHGDQKRQFVAAYYAHWYTSYYSDYYSFYFTRGGGNEATGGEDSANNVAEAEPVSQAPAAAPATT